MEQKVVVTGTLFRDGKVLTIKRSEKEEFLPGEWELPSGKVEWGEDPLLALRREFQEEVGLEIEVNDPIFVFDYISENNTRHTIEVVFQVTGRDEKEVILSNAHSEYKWIGQSEISIISGELRQALEIAFQEQKD